MGAIGSYEHPTAGHVKVVGPRREDERDAPPKSAARPRLSGSIHAQFWPNSASPIRRSIVFWRTERRLRPPSAADPEVVSMTATLALTPPRRVSPCAPAASSSAGRNGRCSRSGSARDSPGAPARPPRSRRPARLRSPPCPAIAARPRRRRWCLARPASARRWCRRSPSGSSRPRSLPWRLRVVGSWIWKKNSSSLPEADPGGSKMISIASAWVPWLR